MAPKKRTTQPFTSWLQDGSDELNLLLVDILERRIDEDDIPEGRRNEINGSVHDLIASISAARDEAQWQREEREAEAAPYAGLRHQQHERL